MKSPSSSSEIKDRSYRPILALKEPQSNAEGILRAMVIIESSKSQPLRFVNFFPVSHPKPPSEPNWGIT
ncbi:CLUMA_CG020411, isoform A [Clunio marinus]|uniref:CLUMA_CG020411, isoform A n=1 Tax=Clunio marinus TaxID=568069 RepID=A0A1J1J4V9_9DIPT|nr:CLUMA_CG020411, isoform A [Clunio marinus]